MYKFSLNQAIERSPVPFSGRSVHLRKILPRQPTEAL